jgi:ABC-type nickel/cobalt efflux system permease component RcnA
VRRALVTRALVTRALVRQTQVGQAQVRPAPIGQAQVRRALAVLAGAAALALLPAAAANAHPLGNFTVNVYSGLRVAPEAVHVDLVLDMAEIPAYQERQSTVDNNGDGSVSPAEQVAYGAAACTRLAGQAALTVGGAPVPLAVDADTVAFPTGQAGLPTLRLSCALTGAARIGRPPRVRYRMDAYADRVGWREVTAVGDRTTLAGSDVPATTRSARLTAYPADLLSSPLDVRAATLDVRPGGAAAPGPAQVSAEPQLRGIDRATTAYTKLISRQDLTVPFGLLAVLLALGLGALHAFAPGHGKTVMAAFLLGRHDRPGPRRAGWRQAASIGLTVTATHTAGVMLLGLALVASVSVAPDRLYPWLGLISGLLLAAVGATLVRRPDRHHRHGHTHSHAGHDHAGHGHQHGHTGDDHAGHDHAGHDHAGHDHAGHDHAGYGHQHGHTGDDHAGDDHASHSHGGHGHPHPHDDGRHWKRPVASRGRLLAMGLVGGLVPSPSALVVLLGAVALGRTWFGVLLVVCYGAGMAACLVGLGALLARGGSLLRRADGNRVVRRLSHALPLLTALVIVVVGVGLASQAAATLISA